MRPITKLLGIASLFVSASIFVDAIQNSANAEITANPNDAGTVVNKNGDTLNIEGGTRADNNLFHSFEKFGLEEGQTANFKSNPEIENILGRVTAGDASVINGVIQVTGGNSNLYLMNPIGIMFGNGASLNVPAAFNATTASGIRFEDNWFKAFGENDYASLVGNPDAFAFTQAGTILNSADLEVGKGQSLTLSGGTVISTGTLKAPGGDITIKAVPEDNSVTITQEGNLLSFGVSKSLRPETKDILNKNNQTFTPSSLPQLLTGGNLNNATGVEVENGVVKLTGSGREIPDKAGTIVVANDINTEGTIRGKIDISSESGNIALDGINEAINLLGDVEVTASDSELILNSDINSSGDVIISASNNDSETSKTVLLKGDINSSGKVEIYASPKNTYSDIDIKTILDGNITSLRDITIGRFNSSDTTLGGDKTTKTVESVAGDIRIWNFNQDINSDSEQSYNLNLIANKGDIKFSVSKTSDISKPTLLNNLRVNAKNITFDGASSDLNGVKAKNYIDLTASNNIGIITNLKSNGDIDLEAGGNITNSDNSIHDSSYRKISLDAEVDTNINAGNKVEIRDGAIITIGRDLLIKGDERINIQAFEDEKSIFKSGNDLTLISDGEITGNVKFESGSNFDIRNLEGGKGNFHQTFTPSTDTIISSEGDVNFGNYDGLSLKIEAKGSITGGDITINDANPKLEGSDPDIGLLNKVPGLVLKAGVEELKNKTNIPSEKVGGTNFTSLEKSSSADIKVGDINTTFGFSGSSVILSTTGNIKTGHIKVRGNPGSFQNIPGITSQSNPIEGFLNLQAEGNIEVKTINSNGPVIGAITIKAGETFRATESFDKRYYVVSSTSETFNDFKTDEETITAITVADENSITIPTSIHSYGASGNGEGISIEDGAGSFIVGPNLRDANGNVIFKDKNGDLLTYSVDASGKIRDEDGEIVNDAGDVIIGSPVNEDDIDSSTSFSAGAIWTQASGNGSMVSSFIDSSLDNNDGKTSSLGRGKTSNLIEITSTSKSPEITENTPSENKNNNSSTGVQNNIQVSPEQESNSNEPANAESEVVQRQLNKKEQDEICSRQKSNIAVNRTGNTRKVESTNNNPCKATNNDDNNILKVIPDNRFNNNSALPADLTTLINPIPRLLNEQGESRKK